MFKKWHKAREVQETVGKFYKDKQKRGSTRFKVWCFRLNSQKKYRISFVRTSIQQKPKNIALCLNHKPNNQWIALTKKNCKLFFISYQELNIACMVDK